MEQLKRSRVSIIHDCDDVKRKKLNITTDTFITVFEDLSNEVVYEVFEYLDFHHAFQAFYNLNVRFQNLFVYSNLPIKINISSISKTNFHRYFKYIIELHSDRIQSFQISTPFAADISLLLLPIMKNFTRLETLIINNIQSEYIEEIIDHLPNLLVLSSLTIVSVDKIQTSNEIHQKIFRLSALKYCQIAIETKSYFHPLPTAVDEFSSIERLVINNEIGLTQLNRLLSYVPKLRHLSVNNLNGSQNSWIQKSSIQLRNITHVSLKLHSVSFTDFELMIIDCFRQTSHLVIHHRCSPTYYMQYLNADGWERLISTHMPNLRIFDCQIGLSSWYPVIDHQVYDTQVQKFNSVFWTTHQWFFEYHYYPTKWTESMIFFSTNPYRRKKYMLYEESNDKIDSHRIHTNMNSVQHLYIHSKKALEQFMGSFPNATELTISKDFYISRDLIATDLNRIVSLRRLTKLTFDCHRFPFEHLIELLTLTPNINTLKLDALLLYRTDSISIQQNNIFQLVSSKNTISNLTINQEITLEKVQLIIALFPRLESLTINLYKEHLKSITRFLLSKSNNNTYYLSTLCITKHRRDLFENLQLLIQSENLLTDYILKFINRTVYLWW